MDTVQATKPDIRNSGKPVGTEVCSIDLQRYLDDAMPDVARDAVYTHKWQAGYIIM